MHLFMNAFKFQMAHNGLFETARVNAVSEEY